MPLITCSVFAPLDQDLPIKFADIIRKNAVDYLNVDPELLAINISFSPGSDSWFFGLAQLNKTVSPSFSVLATIGRGSSGVNEIGGFISATGRELKWMMSTIYPGVSLPDLPDRTKVVVIPFP